MDLLGRLEGLGVPREEAERVVAIAARPPDGLLDPEDAARESGATELLRAALVIASDAGAHATALHAMLASLEEDPSAMSRYDIARFWHLRGVAAWRLDDSAFLAARSLNTAARLLIEEDSLRARRYLARIHDTFAQLLHQQGMVADARRELERSLELRDEVGDRVGSAISLGNLGRLCLNIGDFAAAAVYFERDLALIGPTRGRVRAQILTQLAETRLGLGEIDEANRLLDDAMSIAVAIADVVARIFASIGLGRVQLARGDIDGARTTADEALASARSSNTPVRARATLVASAAKLVADTHLACSRFDAAIENYRIATTELAAASTSSPIEHAEILRGLATALTAKREHADAASSLRYALKHLDASAAEALRRQVEGELKHASYDSWLLHSAGRFIGQQNIEFLLSEAGQQGFRGARRRVIVMFSDIRGFTALSERLPPEELILLLNDYLAQMTRCIERHGGMVDKFMGDGIMAVFPAEPGSGTDAIASALAMSDELERFNRGLGREAPRLSMGIGLHCGEVIAGLIGSPQKREYTVIGDVVNTASRLESMTKQLGASTVVSASVIELADKERFLLRPVGTFVPKGRRIGLRVYDVVAERDRSPATRDLAREIERVEQALSTFESRAFDSAAAAFDALARETDGTARSLGYRMLASKARELEATPPAADWAGEIVLLDK